MHKLRPLRLASLPSRGYCCWRKAGNERIGLFCTVMPDSSGPLFLWPVVVPYLSRRSFPSDPGKCWAVLGLQPAPGSLLGVTASWSSGDMEAVTERQGTNIRRNFLLSPLPTAADSVCVKH